MKSLIEKEYFRLDEVVDDLQIPLGDISYLAENGHLQLSVLVYALSVERGWPQRIAGDEWRIVSIDNPFSLSGLVDLTDADAHQILKEGDARVWHFRADGEQFYGIVENFGPVVVKKADLLMRKKERDRLASLIGKRPARKRLKGFAHSRDFRRVILDGMAFQLGDFQAAVIRQLHDAALAGTPWRHGSTLLRTTGCSSLRMADLFKSQKNWRALVISDGRGMYRLALPEAVENAS